MSDATTTDPAPQAAPAPALAPAAPGNVLGDPAPKPAEPAATSDPAKSATDAPETVGAPEGDYTFTPPDGVTLDQGMLTAYQTAAREAGLTQRQFEALTPKAVEIIQGVRAGQVDAWNEMQRGWQAEVAADRDLAGETPGTLKAEASAAAGRFIAAYGGDALKQALLHTGAGNHPAVIRAFVAAGQAMGDETGTMQPGNTGPMRDNSYGGVAARMFPGM